MIAKTRAPLFVKYHSFAVCTHCLPGITIGSEKSLALLIPPSRSSPAFLSSILDRLERGYANLALTEFSEARRAPAPHP
jgi:hypothetical protein